MYSLDFRGRRLPLFYLNDYRVEVHEGDIQGRFISLKLKSTFQPIYDLSKNCRAKN